MICKLWRGNFYMWNIEIPFNIVCSMTSVQHTWVGQLNMFDCTWIQFPSGHQNIFWRFASIPGGFLLGSALQHFRVHQLPCSYAVWPFQTLLPFHFYVLSCASATFDLPFIILLWILCLSIYSTWQFFGSLVNMLQLRIWGEV